jgi:hypothetical protein
LIPKQFIDILIAKSIIFTLKPVTYFLVRNSYKMKFKIS